MVKSNNQPVCQIDMSGNKCWYLNNQLHRLDGPAIEYADGSKRWYLHGQRHRIDGPAIEYTNGFKYWWYHGKYIKCSSQEEFERLIKLRALW